MSASPAVQIEALTDGRLKFSGGGTFEALAAAESWLTGHGISYGSLQRGAPVGLLRGQAHIAKWRNLSSADISALHGTMRSSDFRFGPIFVHMVGEILTADDATTGGAL